MSGPFSNIFASVPSGESQAGMGVAVGDFDGDGLPDLCVTNFAEDYTALYKNLGKCLFKETSSSAGHPPVGSVVSTVTEWPRATSRVPTSWMCVSIPPMKGK